MIRNVFGYSLMEKSLYVLQAYLLCLKNSTFKRHERRMMLINWLTSFFSSQPYVATWQLLINLRELSISFITMFYDYGDKQFWTFVTLSVQICDDKRAKIIHFFYLLKTKPKRLTFFFHKANWCFHYCFNCFNQIRKILVIEKLNLCSQMMYLSVHFLIFDCRCKT